MSRIRVAAAAVIAAAVALPVMPAAAVPTPTPGPGVCNGRMIELEEGETFEERTLYFHGQAQVGNVDGAQDSQDGGAKRLTMDATPPTASQSRVYVTRPTGVIGNPNFAQNQYHGYWIKRLDSAERVVCAGATVHAGTVTGALTVQLWVDAARGTGGQVTASVVGSAPANQVSAFTVNFGALDVTAEDNLLVQLDSATPGALTHYDSTAHPSQLKYVVVVPAP